MKEAIKPFIKQIYSGKYPELKINDTVGMSYDEFIQSSLTNNSQVLIVYNGFNEVERYEDTGEFADKYSIFIKVNKPEDKLHRDFRTLIDGIIIQDSEGNYLQIFVNSGDYIRPDKNIIIFEVRIECYPS